MAENNVGDNLNLREMIHRKLGSVEQLLRFLGATTSFFRSNYLVFLETIETLMQCVVSRLPPPHIALEVMSIKNGGGC